MDEKQLKQMDSQEDIVFQEEDSDLEEEDSKIEIAEWVVFGLALGFVAVAVGFFLYAKYFK